MMRWGAMPTLGWALSDSFGRGFSLLLVSRWASTASPVIVMARHVNPTRIVRRNMLFIGLSFGGALQALCPLYRARSVPASRISDNSQMPSTAAAPITCVSVPLSAVEADLLVVPWFDDED